MLDNHTIDEKLKALPTSDEIDFRLRENILKCKHCQLIVGEDKMRHFKKDPKMFDYIIKHRAAIRKDRIRANDIGDDPGRIDVIDQKEKAFELTATKEEDTVKDI